MEIIIKKLTDISIVQRACEMTMKENKLSKITLKKIYQCEHSPIRTLIFWIEMLKIPTFVSVHFVRHNIGVTHFVESNREDLGGDGIANRLTPVNHGMFINAQELINMARKRLCSKTHKETRKVMEAIKKEMENIDPDLSNFMVVECEYRNGYCPELKSCGRFKMFKNIGVK